jgi:energy-coupling factor transport system permease protein
MVTGFSIPGTSMLHRHDPRTKLLVLLAFLVFFFLPLPLPLLLVYLSVAALLGWLCLGLRDLLIPLKLIFPLLLLVLLLTPPFHRQGTVLLAPWGFPLYTLKGLETALRLILRFSGITLVFFLYMRSTDPEQMLLSLRWFGLAYSPALVLSLALTYIPWLTSLYGNVRDAHKLRLAGLEQESSAGGFLKRTLGKIPAMTSVMIQAVKGIPVLAMALETRGIGRKNARSSFRELKTGLSFFLDTLIAALLIAGLIMAAVIFP